MIDWFVLLIPLVLLPIFLLFVFVGCGLERMGRWTGDGISNTTTVDFHYVEGVKDAVLQIDIEFKFDGNLLGAVIMEQDDFSADGGHMPAGDILLTSEGEITCEGKVTMVGDLAGADVSVEPKQKKKDEPAPSFTLQASGEIA